MKELTRNCFPNSRPDNFIKNNLDKNRKIIPLSEFILQRQGVCRHHTLLNAYFLSHLVDDGLLKGEIIHHRQDFGKEGAHTWNIYRNNDGKVYSLDSLWNNVTCITDHPNSINKLYGYEVETEINKMHPLKKEIDKAKNEAEHFIKCLERYITSTKWNVGYQFTPKNLPNEPEKRLPTNVALQFEVIQIARKGEITYEDAEEKIKKLGRTAAAENNSYKYRLFPIRHPNTQSYYSLFLPHNEESLKETIEIETCKNKKSGYKIV